MQTKRASTKKTTAKNPAPAKAKPKKPVSGRSTAAPPATHEEKILKLVDEAADLLRSGIKTSASVGGKGRAAARRRAHTLLTRASTALSGAVEETTSALHKIINKTLG